jgi:hypothetical protein
MAHLDASGRNPSVMGFYVQQLIINSLTVRDCSFDEAGVSKTNPIAKGNPTATKTPTIEFFEDARG